jgi:hypothetical protein
MLPVSKDFAVDRVFWPYGLESYDRMVKCSTNEIPVNLGAGSNETEIYVGAFKQLYMWIL